MRTRSRMKRPSSILLFLVCFVSCHCIPAVVSGSTIVPRPRHSLPKPLGFDSALGTRQKDGGGGGGGEPPSGGGGGGGPPGGGGGGGGHMKT
jgi:hypothetical protein